MLREPGLLRIELQSSLVVHQSLAVVAGLFAEMSERHEQARVLRVERHGVFELPLRRLLVAKLVVKALLLRPVSTSSTARPR